MRFLYLVNIIKAINLTGKTRDATGDITKIDIILNLLAFDLT